jgi:5-(carboxyamino)imidazole ribonucleotide synthase
MSGPFLPGSRIGVMGGGQLGRMFAIAARRMGYRVHTFSPEEDSPTGQLADVEIVASFDDEGAVAKFARGVDVITFEFENIPLHSIEWCEQFCPVRPSGRILHIAQNRLREKTFLAEAGFPLPKFRAARDVSDLRAATSALGYPAVLKTAAFGYDGKGQRTLKSEHDLPAAIAEESVLEQFVAFEKELSVVVARNGQGDTAVYPVCENRHRNHILDLTIVPAQLPPETETAARALAKAIAGALELTGLLAVEMFLLGDGSLLINELAPRPHNSGHFSFDACVTSQFEQQLRAVCGLPLGSTALLRPAAMANLLGDLWQNGEPDWSAALTFPEVKLHLYGKSEPRPGRKMGHLVALDPDPGRAEQLAVSARAALTTPSRS